MADGDRVRELAAQMGGTGDHERITGSDRRNDRRRYSR